MEGFSYSFPEIKTSAFLNFEALLPPKCWNLILKFSYTKVLLQPKCDIGIHIYFLFTIEILDEGDSDSETGQDAGSSEEDEEEEGEDEEEVDEEGKSSV